MKHFKKFLMLVTVMAIAVLMVVPFSAFAATLTRGPNFWYCVNWVDGETFKVDGGVAYCVNPGKAIPSNGNYTEVQVNNDNLLKVLYYGYGGKGFNNTTKAKMDGYRNNNNITASGNDLYYALTHRCAAKAYGSNYRFDTFDDWNAAIDNMYSYFQSLQKPSGCKAYVVNSGGYGQTIAYIVHDKEILLQIHKRSANAAISDNNSCYSLQGAVYDVFTDAACTQKIGEMTTNINGYANYPARVSPDKTYYAKERIAPKGFAVSDEVLQFKDVGNISSTTGLNIYMAYPYDTPQNDPVRIVLNKLGKNNQKLPGAEFTVKHYPAPLESYDTATPKTWILKTGEKGSAYLTEDFLVSGDDFYMTGSGNPCLPLGTVTIQETKAPKGYKIDEKVYIFPITGDESASEFVETFNAPTFINDSFNVHLSKTDENGQLLAGALVQLLDKNGTVLEEWTTTDSLHPVEAELVPGETYTYHEVKAPDGYTLAEDVTFVYTGNSDLTKQMVDIQTETYITKTDITGDEELEGAHLSLAEENGKVIEEWTSTTSAHLIKGLVAGKTYVLTETIAPNGYAIATPIRFTVNSDGMPTYVVMKDKLTETVVSKKSITGDDELPGAHLKVVDDKGKTVDEWISTDKEHLIKGLIGGKSYRLIETIAPDGYSVASEITFTVKTDGSVTNVTMKDSPTVTVISKKSITGDDELEGATLQVKDDKGDIIEEWVSGKEPHEIKGLVGGKVYTLVETVPAPGYSIAKDIQFFVNIDGTTTKVFMVDEPTVTVITKKDITTGDELPGATLQVIDEHDNIIDEWVSTEEPHEIKGLIAGKTYKLVEILPPPGYSVSTPDEFTVKEDGSTTIVEMKDELTHTVVSKTDMTGTNELPGAQMKVVDENGETVDEWTSAETAHNIDGLIAGKTYTLIETISPDGYTTSEAVDFTVLADGSVTKVTMKDDVTRFNFVKTDDENKPLKGAKLQLLDEEGNIVEEWISDGTPHAVEGKLIVGKKYVLHEVEAPEGYDKAEDITFEVKDTSELQTITMVDIYKGDVKISTPDQPVTPNNSYNGGGYVQTGQQFPFVVAGVVVISAFMILLFRKRKNY